MSTTYQARIVVGYRISEANELFGADVVSELVDESFWDTFSDAGVVGVTTVVATWLSAQELGEHTLENDQEAVDKIMEELDTHVMPKPYLIVDWY